MTLSLIGWIIVLSYIVLLSFTIFFGIWIIWKSLKPKSRVLLYYGFSLIVIGCMVISASLIDLFTIYITGTNMDNGLFAILSLMWLPPLSFFIILYASTLLTPTLKWKIFSAYVIMGIIFWVFLFSNPLQWVEVYYLTVPSQETLQLTLKIVSPLTLIIGVWVVIMFLIIFGFAYKGLNAKAEIRKKYLYLTIGNLIFIIHLVLNGFVRFYQTVSFIGIFSIPFVYMGLHPKKLSKPKRKIVSEAEKKFVSFITGKREKSERLVEEFSKDAKLEKDLLVFMSYATKDADLFKIQEISNKLTNTPEVKDVLYWQEDLDDNIFEYMNDNLGKCHVFVLFCSTNALESVPVKKEWTAADAMGKPIIPVFYDTDHIPPLLRSRLGIEYDFYDIDSNIRALKNIIFKKYRGLIE
ncbi:MAG: toll/interleukin-1 receptor domain-containing protein [Promethearchaeota archaeon]